MDAKKQTAVEWLEEQRKWSVITNEHIEQAKAIEKEQIENSYNTGYNHSSWGRFSDPEKHYNQTFDL